MILYLGDIKLKTGMHKPLMKKHAGQEWATGKIYINEAPVECHFDRRMGSNMYFQYGERWHYIRMESQYGDIHPYSFNPTSEKVKFKTT